MNTALKERIVALAILFAAILVSALIIGTARAQTETENAAPGGNEAAISFPIPELGNCASKDECKTYCDQPNNMEACITFAEKNGLMPEEEVAMAKKFMAAGGKGPGGCTGKDSCEQFCNDISNIDACVTFAEQSGMMPPEELDEAKKVQAAIKRGVKPPACGGKRACDAYCEDPNHIEECVAFASAAGFMSPEEQANAQKMVQAIKSGVKPLPCRGKEECDAYCGQEENIQACITFAEAAGFMSQEEATMAKKTGGRGPGGCKGKEACDAFCNSSPENEEVCFNFQVEKGLMSEERRRQMEGDKQKMKESFSNMPSDVEQCIRERIGSDTFEKLKTGEQRVTRTIGEAMPSCWQKFESMREAEENGRREREGGPPPEGQGFRGERRERSFEGEGRYGGPSTGAAMNGGPSTGAAMNGGPRDGQRFDPRCEGGGCEGTQGGAPREGQVPMMEPRSFERPEGQGAFEGSIGPRQFEGQGAFGEPVRELINGFVRPEDGVESGIAPSVQRMEIAPPPPTDGGSSTDAATTGGTAPAEPVAPAPVQEPAPAPAPAPVQEPVPAQGTTGSISPNSMVGSAINALRSLFLLR